jgi:hypothetical protein
LRRKEEEEEDEQRKREFKSDNMDFEKMEKLHLFFLLVESYKPPLSAHVDPTKLISVFQQQIYPMSNLPTHVPRLHPCLLLTPALHSMGKNNTSFGLCATDTFSLARTNVQLAKLATDILDDAQKKEHSFGLALNFNQRCWKNRVLVVSQSGNHSVLFFSFLSPFEWPASHRERERERERDGWIGRSS